MINVDRIMPGSYKRRTQRLKREFDKLEKSYHQESAQF